MKALVCVHGFGAMRTKDFIYLKDQFEDSYIHYVDFNIYELQDTPNWRMWVKCAYKEVKRVIDEGYEVTLLGFSMGGVIASYLASRLPVKRLVLVAPAVVYLGLDSGSRYLKKLAKLHHQNPQELQAFINDRWLDIRFVKAFLELVSVLRQSCKEIPVPVLILHSTKDDIVPLFASRYVMRMIPHVKKTLYLLDGGSHEVLSDIKLGKEAYYRIVEFMNQEISTGME